VFTIIIRERKATENLLEELFQAHGKEAWLGNWDIKPILFEKREYVETLSGSAPSKVKGE